MTVYTDDFEAVWKIYPNKDAKKRAFEIWKKLNPDEALIAKITENVRAMSQGKWKKNPDYVPQFATYLNGERWNDETKSEVSTHKPSDYDVPDDELFIWG